MKWWNKDKDNGYKIAFVGFLIFCIPLFYYMFNVLYTSNNFSYEQHTSTFVFNLVKLFDLPLFIIGSIFFIFGIIKKVRVYKLIGTGFQKSFAVLLSIGLIALILFLIWITWLFLFVTL